MLNYLGRLSFGQAAPLCVVANAQLGQAITIALTGLEAQLAGLLRVSLALTVKPPSFLATVEGIAKVAASLRLTGPVVTLQAAAVLDLIAALKLQIAALHAMIQIPLGGSMHAYWYTGSAGAFGGELAASTAGGFPGGRPSDNTAAIVLAGVEPATILILKAIFKTSP